MLLAAAVLVYVWRQVSHLQPRCDRWTHRGLADCYSNPYIELREMAFLLN